MGIPVALKETEGVIAVSDSQDDCKFKSDTEEAVKEEVKEKSTAPCSDPLFSLFLPSFTLPCLS